jgi:hypothetical protein
MKGKARGMSDNCGGVVKILGADGRVKPGQGDGEVIQFQNAGR